MPVSEYMALALGHPKLGYYARQDASGRGPLGRGGDFITAPEISQVFGELLAAWCVGVWQAMGSPRPVTLAELGPGRGTLLTDLWRAASAVAADFAAALRLHLVETSETLRAAQKARLCAIPLPCPALLARACQRPASRSDAADRQRISRRVAGRAVRPRCRLSGGSDRSASSPTASGSPSRSVTRLTSFTGRISLTCRRLRTASWSNAVRRRNGLSPGWQSGWPAMAVPHCSLITGRPEAAWERHCRRYATTGGPIR